jgi:hypothetical protein
VIATWLVVAAAIGAPATWRAETFTFPLAFAPSIPYEGTEHVRFSPGWQDFSGPEGFTYVILWDIKRRAIEPAEIERGLTVYFDGLMENVTRGRKIPDPGTVTSATLNPMEPPKGWSQGMSGKLYTWNGFAKGEPLVLNTEITVRPCGSDRTQVFLAFSKSARDASAWPELRGIREKTACESS